MYIIIDHFNTKIVCIGKKVHFFITANVVSDIIGFITTSMRNKISRSILVDKKLFIESEAYLLKIENALITYDTKKVYSLK
jgi:hypothetical protein